jgi:hypothetical protein
MARLWLKAVSLDTVWTTMTAAKEAGHDGQDAQPPGAQERPAQTFVNSVPLAKEKLLVA